MFKATLWFKHSLEHGPIFVNVEKGVTNDTCISWPCAITHHITLQTYLLSLLSPGLENGPLCFLKHLCFWVYMKLDALASMHVSLPPLPLAMSTSLPPVYCSPHTPLTSSAFCSWWFFFRSQWTVSWSHWVFFYLRWLNSSATSSAITLCSFPLLHPHSQPLFSIPF